jgi:uncharacterized lipoprotein YddW (UPF0748 family)
MKNRKINLNRLWIFLILIFHTVASTAEFRQGIWLRPPATEAELFDAVDSIAAAGIQLIFLETWYHSYPIYPSKITEQRPEFRGWNPLQAVIDRAHARNVEVHAWVEVFYAYNPDYLDGSKGPVLSRHPNWQALSANPDNNLAEEGKIFFNPAHPELRQFLLDVFRELAERYAIDGINLDYIRYPVDPGDQAFGYDPVSIRLFQAETGLDIRKISRADKIPWSRLVQWKCTQVSSFVDTLCQQLKTQNPQLQISAAIFPDYRTDPLRSTKCQDWEKWVQGDLLDFITPMCYAPKKRQRQAEIQEALELSKVPVLIGYALNRVNKTRDLEQLIRVAIQEGTNGIVWFAYNWRKDFFFPTLKNLYLTK